MGTQTQPVYQWRWTSAPRRVVAGLARGLERFDTLPAAAAPAAQVCMTRGGGVAVVLSRALATTDTANELQFRTGRAIPVASSRRTGPTGKTARVWLSAPGIPRARPTYPPRVYISPWVAMALTLGVGLLVVWRAQRPSRGTDRAGTRAA